MNEWGPLHNLVTLVQVKKHEAANFTKSNIRRWVFFTLFKLYQIAQIITYEYRRNPYPPPHHPHPFNKEGFLDVLIFSKKQFSENVVSGGW